jgi:hypothetical protein
LAIWRCTGRYALSYFKESRPNGSVPHQ